MLHYLWGDHSPAHILRYLGSSMWLFEDLLLMWIYWVLTDMLDALESHKGTLVAALFQEKTPMRRWKPFWFKEAERQYFVFWNASLSISPQQSADKHRWEQMFLLWNRLGNICCTNSVCQSCIWRTQRCWIHRSQIFFVFVSMRII